MTDLDKLKSILDNQAERGIKSGDWDRLDYTVSTGDEAAVIIDSVQVGFRFTSAGRLIGMWHWE